MSLEIAGAWIAAGGFTALVLFVIWAGEGAIVRYLLAMFFAALCALISTLFISSPVASWVTNRMTFESPDGAGDVHIWTFLLVNIAALIVGWSLGWLMSRSVAQRTRDP
ncbi:MAG: hypothetical protein AAFZ05_09205 [Pseudomonadota bacterium]